MSPCSRLLRCFRPPRSSSSVARSMPFWPGGTGQARCGFGARWFSSSTCLRLHARGTGQLVSPLCGSQCVLRVPAHGAIRGEGAMSSRGSGFGTGAGRSCHQGSLLSRPGIGMLGWTPRWASSCCSPCVPRILQTILCPPTCGSFSRRFPGILTSCPCKLFNLKFSTTCGTGFWDHHMGCGPTPFVPRCQILSTCRAIWTLFTRRFVPIEPFVDGWGPQSTESRSFLQRVAAVVIPLIGSALVVSKECVPPASQCSKSVRFAANFRRLMTIVGSSAGAQAMVYRAQVAGAVDAPPDEPAPSSGWRAEDSLARVAGARAITWRRERGYEKDEDFAFAFSTWEEAVAVGGHFLADAWLAVRVAQQDELLPAAARLLGGVPCCRIHVLHWFVSGRKFHLRRGYAFMSGCRISPSPYSAKCWPCRRCS